MSVSSIKKDIRIQVAQGNEYRTLIMDIYKENDFFYESYRQAAAIVSEIVYRSKQYSKQKEQGAFNLNVYPANTYLPKPSYDPCAYHLKNYPNNILPFCAERGQGKTSAMFSMAEALRTLRDNAEKKQQQDYWNDPAVNVCAEDESANPVLNTRFEVLDSIDPTMMEKGDSIVKNIISKMFKNASEKWENRITWNLANNFEVQSNQSLRDTMLKKFVECFRSVDRLNSDKNDRESSYDDLNLLADHGDSASFKNALADLVELYLRFTAFGDESRAMLVIQIDDADLNIRNAHAIVEEIRKYLVMPNVLVLMSLNTGTLSRTIEQYFLSQYKDYLTYGDKEMIRRKCHDIMEKYIEKLIPSPHRVYMPKVDHYLRDGYNNLNLMYTAVVNGDNTDMIRINKELVNDGVNIDRYQEKLIMLIYLKTGIVLVKPEYYLHNFLPSNMRMLNHFVVFLTGMDDLITRKDGVDYGTMHELLKLCQKYLNSESPQDLEAILHEVDRHLTNLRKFEDYFFNSWCTMYLNNTQLELVETIKSTSRAMKNVRALDLLEKYATDIEKSFSAKEQKGLDSRYVPFSDISYTLYRLNHLPNPQEHFNLICAVKMYYTIYFHTLTLEGIKTWANQGNAPSPFRDLAVLTGYRLFPLEYYRKKKIKDIIIKNPSTRKTHFYDYGYREFAHFLCELVIDENGATCIPNSPVVAFEELKSSYVFTKKNSYFDLFRPIISVLNIEDFNDSFGDELSGFNTSVVDSLLRIICNVDVQNLIYDQYFKANTKPSIAAREKFYDNICSQYAEIDRIINENLVMKSNSTITLLLRKNDMEDTLFQGNAFDFILRDDNGSVFESVFEDDAETDDVVTEPDGEDAESPQENDASDEEGEAADGEGSGATEDPVGQGASAVPAPEQQAEPAKSGEKGAAADGEGSGATEDPAGQGASAVPAPEHQAEPAMSGEEDAAAE